MIVFATWAVTGILAVTVALGLFRVMTAKDAATRAVIGDLVFFCCVAILMTQGVLQGSVVWIDLAAIGAILGVVATIALSRILTRGRR
ncbi:MAG: transporter [Arachnia propionica]|nr:MAG: transporter [Arachnia propionica]